MTDHVATRNLSWQELVQRSWGKDWTEPDIAYEFTNRTFEDRRAPNRPPVVSAPLSQYATDYADGYS